MRLLQLPGDRSADSFWEADRATSRYLIRVLRLGEGAEFSAADAAGNRFRCIVLKADPDDNALIRLEADGMRRDVKEASDVPLPVSAAGFDLALVQALPKGRKLDMVIRQATEAGVRLIIPVVTEHCVARDPGAERSGARSGRYERIVREALQQSGSDVPTSVAPITPFDSLAGVLDASGFAEADTLHLFCHESPLAKGSLHDYCANDPGKIVVAIGPEGGFSASECGRFLDMGFKPLHFRGAVLRTETAALYAVAAIKTVRSERSSWKPTI